MHINEKEEKIVVLQQFSNVIEANIARTKLEAYDIPCFLTDEHFVSLYPIQNEVFPGVRLCIFEKDEQRARALMEETSLHPFTDDIVHCIHCKSEQVEINQQDEGWVSNLISSIKTLLFIPTKKTYLCKSCHREFLPS